MAQFQAIMPGVEVNGQTVLSLANGLGAMKAMGLRLLAENGIKDPVADGWYNQQLWLNAFKQISEKIGALTLYTIGMSIPENAKFPPQINSIHAALAAIDVAFHMNHRLSGMPMFNPANSQLAEGIGHYRYKKISDTKAEISCDNSYPCEFDKGIIEAMAKKFKPANSFVRVEHDESKGCRKKGGNCCLYTVSW